MRPGRGPIEDAHHRSDNGTSSETGKAAARKNQSPAELARRYLKLVEWSDRDGCFIGSAPPIIGPCCHGKIEADVMAQLSTIVEEWVEVMLRDGHPLPAGTAGKKYSGQFVVRIAPELHKKFSLKALARGESLNQLVAGALAAV